MIVVLEITHIYTHTGKRKAVFIFKNQATKKKEPSCPVGKNASSLFLAQILGVKGN